MLPPAVCVRCAVLLPADAVCVHVAVHERQALLRRRHNSTAVPPVPVLHGKNLRDPALQHNHLHRVPSGVLWDDRHAARSSSYGTELLDIHSYGGDGYAGGGGFGPGPLQHAPRLHAAAGFLLLVQIKAIGADVMIADEIGLYQAGS